MRTHKREIGWAAAWLIVIYLLLVSTASRADSLTPSQMQAGSLLMRMEQGYVTATLLNTDVNIRVNGLLARVSVMQEFRNEGTEWVEGVYVFPLPDKAAVDEARRSLPRLQPARPREGEVDPFPRETR